MHFQENWLNVLKTIGRSREKFACAHDFGTKERMSCFWFYFGCELKGKYLLWFDLLYLKNRKLTWRVFERRLNSNNFTTTRTKMLIHFQSYMTLNFSANTYLYGVVTQMAIRVKESFEHWRKRNPSGDRI